VAVPERLSWFKFAVATIVGFGIEIVTVLDTEELYSTPFIDC
jgi:hypothetical protein